MSSPTALADHSIMNIAEDDTPNTTPAAVSNTVTPTPEVAAEIEGQDFVHEQDFEDDDSEQVLSLPLSKIKRIFRMDPDYLAASQNAVYATGLATELFIQYFVEQASLLAKMDKRKKITYKDFSNAVASHDSLNFLSDTVPKTQPIGSLLERKVVNVPSKVDPKAFKENLMGKPEEQGQSKSTVKKKSTLSKGQQTLPFAATKAEPRIKKAVIDDLVITEQTPSKEPTPNDGPEEVEADQVQEDVVMAD
ncbi:histone-fold-containing protein [Suhomyces tanzawaensis NRRL Y-17324]|uniref:Histone-fold-containing protein n=1 Tax=Suhomyces tanzawaensis NRRL Y-17324 TaxID=984487 RepID=A0A1E4SCY1_9ASCO|nr:histone-fold-containing protein [Suhomyces tanzawaensis NRRL Y-17324]ODV77369.1 histone-fold-containing protein [Suhomyces tanzawaensis NRRL Y-17324]